MDWFILSTSPRIAAGFALSGNTPAPSNAARSPRNQASSSWHTILMRVCVPRPAPLTISCKRCLRPTQSPESLSLITRKRACGFRQPLNFRGKDFSKSGAPWWGIILTVAPCKSSCGKRCSMTGSIDGSSVKMTISVTGVRPEIDSGAKVRQVGRLLRLNLKVDDHEKHGERS